MQAVVDTSKGPIAFLLRTQEAPVACENFIRLVREGFYQNLTWHRVIPNFVAQAGCPKGDGTGGPGYTIQHEKNERKHEKGAVAMARLPGELNHGSQFYISRGKFPHLDGDYTVFGNVTSGLGTLDKLVQGDTIKSIRIVEE